MDINVNSYYVNPNNMAITSNLKNTQVYNKSEYAAMASKLRPVENLVGSLNMPMKLASSNSIDKRNNSINICLGTSVNVPGGLSLKVREKSVEVVGVCNYDNQKEYQQAQDMAGALATLLRNAGGTQKEVGYSSSEITAWNENVKKVLSYFGIDTSKDFSVNGMKYYRNENGLFESERECEAKLAYEQMNTNNKIFNFADDRTKKWIDYVSDYYLKNVPESVQIAWKDTLEQTGVNPFQTGVQSTLTQLAIEQDFMTGGNDDLLGNSEESCLDAISRILDRIDNPLGAVDERKASFLEQEKIFYTELYKNIA